MIGAPRIVRDSDVQRGLQAVAAAALGSVNRWTDIVALNRLQPPYLTFDPTLVYGVSLASTTLGGAVAQGATSFAVSVPTQQWQPGFTVVFAQASATGLISESATIESYDGTTMALEAGLQNGYLQGATLLLYGPHPVGSTAVLMPGQVLYLPVDDASTTFVLSQGGQTTDVFGSDLQVPFAWSGGDIAMVAGPATLIQRLRTVVTTPRGSLPHAPLFGARLGQVLGAPTGSVRWNSWVRAALMSLPEVEQVTDVSVAPAQGQLLLSAKVWVRTSKAPLVLQNESLTLPVVN